MVYPIRDDITIRCDASSMISALLSRCIDKDYSEKYNTKQFRKNILLPELF